MKFNCGLSPEEKFEARVNKARSDNESYIAYAMEWHKYFAWWPTRVGSKDCRWLETIERRASGIDSMRDRELNIRLRYVYAWDYRPLTSAVSQSVQQSP